MTALATIFRCMREAWDGRMALRFATWTSNRLYVSLSMSSVCGITYVSGVTSDGQHIEEQFPPLWARA